ncbi:MAG TPA: phosphoribosylformylglycinamidine cyclo-ligase [Polyangiaceae bacterium LLY-WYZ-15_(1-7)]|nr:phosphoribosylformylglycinamidine cyclo-ligase [Sandaracinus sp.]HJL01342.1 phosphoribosylformylglycinamidine cyclo-ligase [Polyangiaceae bacterium LLY-WYZ-15_(1-7)]HJL10605.1 phosphoribosylformylglycinamidine cyclo-ligase [Polyangiaceae bacterium LLY-WYZ-15_(1-7)]HJL24435.1 phosphoribosylformylglycinamidine cyclo-ligase [Polyangiaceae bacterium LLY-WYZ-15_(1-7)]HJL31944.1 phosphoribosylformylglycinamidine cyclo-ligase [Polyangiaceae bacterium LLY-WYZ-15_(1-7)]
MTKDGGEGLTYKDAGVDIDAGERLVERIRPLAAATRTPHVLGGVGGFAGLCAIPPGMKEPILVSGTDGVGTKLKLAFAADRHATVGIDLVAMCVNDVLTIGATPLFFLDYFATGHLDVDQAAAVVEGIAEGCKQAGCALLGGETAELPGFYGEGEYDLAGFSVGVVDRAAILDPARVQAGDVLLGLPSSGLHSNGYSLARRALFAHAGHDLHAELPGVGEPLVDALLRPTRIYAKATRAALSVEGAVHALCHVTGGGLPGNLPRVLPDGLGAQVDGAWPVPPIFDAIREAGSVAEAEMRRTFNLGIGFVLAVAAEKADETIAALREAGEPAVHRLGVVVESDAEGEARVAYGADA